VLARAAVAVAAGTDFVVEGAIDLGRVSVWEGHEGGSRLPCPAPCQKWMRGSSPWCWQVDEEDVC